MDYISDLPQSIIEIILTFLPIRDAVRTCMLSRKWRYRWTTLSNLVFDDNCAIKYDDGNLVTNSLRNFITRTLFLHQGPIHKFQLHSARLYFSPDIDQWILFLSRGDVKELSLGFGSQPGYFRVPSCVYNCKKLTRLELHRCELDPPPAFKGFLWLKSLCLYVFVVSPEAIESFISSCPLLENLVLSCPSDSYFVLNVRAPNLQYLCLEGEFFDICLENTPLLVDVSVSMCMTEGIADFFEQSLGCNFIKFFGGAPRLERLIGHWLFTKYLSIGDYRRMQPMTCSCLKVIELYEVNFEDMEEILVLLHLITNSPYLKELQISGISDVLAAIDAPDLDFWEKGCLKGCTFKYLKVVKMTYMSGVPHEMEFIKFLLANSPVLEMMSISPVKYGRSKTNGSSKMLIELLQFRRASAQAEIFFVEE